MKADITFVSDEAQRKFLAIMGNRHFEAEIDGPPDGYESAVEAVAVLIAGDELYAADCEGSGWDAETDSTESFMPAARRKARRFLDAALPHLVSGE
jgi:hypothetical protein